MLAPYRVGCGGEALWTCVDSLHAVSPAHCFWKITSSDCKSLQLTLLIQLWLVSVSTWSSFGRNRNSTVPFCHNRNQAETIFLGGFGQNTVTETEFRSVSSFSVPMSTCLPNQLRGRCSHKAWLMLSISVCFSVSMSLCLSVCLRYEADVLTRHGWCPARCLLWLLGWTWHTTARQRRKVQVLSSWNTTVLVTYIALMDIRHYYYCWYYYYYTVSQKTRHLTLAHNFTKYWPIFKILSLLDSVGNS